MEVMDRLNLKDEQKAKRALNSVLAKINMKISGIRSKEAAVTIPGTLIHLSGAKWGNSTKILTLPYNIKCVEKVYVVSGETEYEFYSKSHEQVREYSDNNYYYWRSSYSIQFAADNSLIETDGSIIYLEVRKTLDMIDSATKLSVPEEWRAGLVSGMLCELTQSGEYRDEFIYKENKDLYWAMLEELEGWDNLRVPSVESEPAYNYQTPGVMMK